MHLGCLLGQERNLLHKVAHRCPNVVESQMLPVTITCLMMLQMYK
jgi:hypothetical protein